MAQYMFVPRAAQRAAAAEHDARRPSAAAAAVAAHVTDVPRPGVPAAVPAVSPAASAAMAQPSKHHHAAATFIRQLDIQDFALISRQRIDLMPGLNVVCYSHFLNSHCFLGLLPAQRCARDILSMRNSHPLWQ